MLAAFVVVSLALSNIPAVLALGIAYICISAVKLTGAQG